MCTVRHLKPHFLRSLGNDSEFCTRDVPVPTVSSTNLCGNLEQTINAHNALSPFTMNMNRFVRYRNCTTLQYSQLHYSATVRTDVTEQRVPASLKLPRHGKLTVNAYDYLIRRLELIAARKIRSCRHRHGSKLVHSRRTVTTTVRFLKKYNFIGQNAGKHHSHNPTHKN